MLDRDTGVRFDQDPNSDRSLSATTLQFLQAYRASDEFRFHYNGNLSLVGDLNHLSEIGRREAIWSREFVNRLFRIDSVKSARTVLEPWRQWEEIHSHIWSKYRSGEAEDTQAEYKAAEAQFEAVEVPPAIKERQGDLLDEELRSLAHWEIFRLTGDIRESIDLFEGIERPVSLDTIFRAQRIMGQAVVPAGGLEPDIVNKPSVRRVEYGGKNYIVFDFDGIPSDGGFEDHSSDSQWARWNQMEVGTHIQYVYRDYRTEQRTLETGSVQGFYLLAAGDEMLFSPSLQAVGIIALNDRTRLYQSPLVRDIRLGSEEFTPLELTKVEKPKPVEVVFMKPPTGEVNQQTFGSMEEATEAVIKQIKGEIEKPSS